VPSLPEPTDLQVDHAAGAPGARELHPCLGRPRVRALLDRWLAHRIGSRRRRIAKAKTAVPTLADLWNAWAVAELECAIALRAWQLAPRRGKQAPYEAYRGALEREAAIAGELRLRTAR
jgi:hypothetical protein